MLPNIFRDAFTAGNFTRKNDDLVSMFQNEYREEYKHLRRMGTPVTRKLVKDFLATKSL